MLYLLLTIGVVAVCVIIILNVVGYGSFPPF
jgi:hypothetical protein